MMLLAKNVPRGWCFLKTRPEAVRLGAEPRRSDVVSFHEDGIRGTGCADDLLKMPGDGFLCSYFLAFVMKKYPIESYIEIILGSPVESHLN